MPGLDLLADLASAAVAAGAIGEGEGGMTGEAAGGAPYSALGSTPVSSQESPATGGSDLGGRRILDPGGWGGVRRHPVGYS
jgi:hypothetical protein